MHGGSQTTLHAQVHQPDKMMTFLKCKNAAILTVFKVYLWTGPERKVCRLCLHHYIRVSLTSHGGSHGYSMLSSTLYWRIFLTSIFTCSASDLIIDLFPSIISLSLHHVVFIMIYSSWDRNKIIINFKDAYGASTNLPGVIGGIFYFVFNVD